MAMLNIGLLAVVAAFSSGIVSINRAGRITTAAVLADGRWSCTAPDVQRDPLDPATIPGTVPYTTDTAYNASQVTGTCTGSPPECNASRQVTGADGKPYRVDTFIVTTAPTGGRNVKKITVVVRDYDNLTKTYARQVSTFDQSTGG